MASNSASSSLPKWQLALVVGAPVALGLGYMYYRNCSTTEKSEDKSSKNSRRHVKENGEKQISIDGDVPGKTGKGAAAEVRSFSSQKNYLKFMITLSRILIYSILQFDEKLLFINL